MEIKIKNKNGVKLLTSQTYCDEDITVTLDNSLFEQDYSIEDGLITRTLTSYVNNRITEIGERALSGFASLTYVECDNVESLGPYCFMNCTGLTKIDFPKLTLLGTNAFNGCTKLEIVKFGSLEAVSEINRTASIRLVYLPRIKTITGGTFADCSGLEAVIITRIDTIVTVQSNAFVRSGVANGTGFIYVDDSKVNDYKQATNWSTYAEQIKGLSELPNNIKEELGL